jgi:hypothetical protein
MLKTTASFGRPAVRSPSNSLHCVIDQIWASFVPFCHWAKCERVFLSVPYRAIPAERFQAGAPFRPKLPPYCRETERRAFCFGLARKVFVIHGRVILQIAGERKSKCRVSEQAK